MFSRHQALRGTPRRGGRATDQPVEHFGRVSRSNHADPPRPVSKLARELSLAWTRSMLGGNELQREDVAAYSLGKRRREIKWCAILHGGNRPVDERFSCLLIAGDFRGGHPRRTNQRAVALEAETQCHGGSSGIARRCPACLDCAADVVHCVERRRIRWAPGSRPYRGRNQQSPNHRPSGLQSGNACHREPSSPRPTGSAPAALG